jgi:hypothetical protein
MLIPVHGCSLPRLRSHDLEEWGQAGTAVLPKARRVGCLRQDVEFRRTNDFDRNLATATFHPAQLAASTHNKYAYPRLQPHALSNTDTVIAAPSLPRNPPSDRNHDPRVCLVLPSSRLRQGRSRMVRTPHMIFPRGRRKRIYIYIYIYMAMAWKRLTYHVQPRVHASCWSHPQVWLEHLPSVLQRAQPGHWFHQGTLASSGYCDGHGHVCPLAWLCRHHGIYGCMRLTRWGQHR